MRHRIAVVCGPEITHKNTCATLIRKGLNVTGICIADQRTAGLPLQYLRRAAKKKGWRATLSRMLARVQYSVQNSRQDKQIFSRLFDQASIEATLAAWAGPIYRTPNYSTPETLAWLKKLEPDVIVAHTPYWIGKAVRNIPRTRIVLGGHPGLTPNYRGSHSAFWALYRNQPEDVGCTAFVLDEGVDTGDIVAQRRLPIEEGDSFVTLGWKGMITTAEMQAQVLADFDAGVAIPRRPVDHVPENSEFDNPTLGEYLTYKSRQHAVR